MPQQFNLVAQLKLQGPKNLGTVVKDIETRLKNVKANIELTFPKGLPNQMKMFNDTLKSGTSELNRFATQARVATGALQQLHKEMQRTGMTMKDMNKSSQKASAHTKAMAKDMKTAANSIQDFGHKSALAVKRFLAFSIPAGLILGLTTNIRAGVKAAIDFEREMIRVQQVTGKTSRGLMSLTSAIGQLSTELGVASNELVVVSRTLAQAGLNAAQTQKAMAAIAKTDLSPTFDSMQQTTEGAIAAMRQFQLESSQLERALGSLNAVAGSFAVESADIISAIRRTGGAFKAAGGNLEELIALFTSVRSTTRESADSIATGFRTIFTRLQRPRTIQFLKEFNIELQEAGKFVGPFKAIAELSSKLASLDPRDVRFSRITEELGGFRQVSKVIPLIQQFAVSEQALQVAIAGANSVSEDAVIAQKALAVQIQKVREEYLKLARDVVSSPLFRTLTDGAIKFANALARVLRSLEAVAPILLGAGVVGGARALRPFIGGAIGRNKGGHIPGSGNRDTVPAMLTPGEFVLKKSAAKAIGSAGLHSLNNVQHFANGGSVRGQGNVGRGTGRTILGAAILGPLLQSTETTSEAMNDLTTKITSAIIAFESFRLAIGVGQSIGPMRGGRGGFNRLRTGAGAAFFGRDAGTRGRGRAVLGKLTKQFTGLSAVSLGLTAALGATSAILITWGTSLQNTAKEQAKTARTEKSLNAAISKSRTGGALKGAGLGALTLGAIGTAVAGPVGTIVGGVLGGIGGAIVGAILGSNEKELRAINRQARATEVNNELTKSIENLLSGNINILGSRDLVNFGKQLEEQNKLVAEARAGGTDEESLAAQKTRRSFLPQIEQVKNALLDNVTTLQAFEKAGGAGAHIIETLSTITDKSTKEIRASIAEDIDRRQESISIQKEYNSALSEVVSTMNLFVQFNSALKDINANLERTGINVGVSGALAGGSFAGSGSFRGRPGFGQLSRVASGGDLGQAMGGLDQLMGGMAQSRIGANALQRTRNMAQILSELPDILSEVGMAGALDPESLTRQFGAVAQDRFGNLEGGQQAINIITRGIDQFLDSRSSAGPGEFLRRARSDPQSLLMELGGKQLTEVFQELDKIAQEMLSASKTLDSAIQARSVVEMSIAKQRVEIEQQRLQAGKALFAARNRGDATAIFRGADTATRRQVGGLIGPGIDPLDVSGIGQKFRDLSRELEREVAARQNLTVGTQAFSDASDNIGRLNTEVNKYRMALNLLTDTTNKAAEIQQTLNLLEEQKKARFGIAERFAFGSREDRQKLLQSIADTFQAVEQGRPLDTFSSQRRSGILSLLNSFRNTQAVAFGGQTGLQAKTGLVGRRIGRIPNVAGGNLSIDEFNPLKPNTQQQALITELRDLFVRRDTAEQELLTGLQERNTTMTNEIAATMKDFTTSFMTQFELAIVGSLNRQVQAARAEAGTADVQLSNAKDAARIASGILGRSVSTTGGARIAQTFATRQEDIATIRKQQQRITSVGDAKNTKEALTEALTPVLKEQVNKGTNTAEIASAIKATGIISQLSQQGLIGSEEGVVQALTKTVGDALTNRKFTSALGTEENLVVVKAFRDASQGDELGVSKSAFSKLIFTLAQDINKAIIQNRNERLTGLGAQAGVGEQDFFVLMQKRGNAFAQLGQALKTLKPTELEELAKNFERLSGVVEDLNNRLGAVGGAGATRRAGGGSIFKRQGTDTVPAMLTPGEFVVRRSVAQKNMGLLTALNSGVQRFANGGRVKTYEEILAERRAEYEREMARRRSEFVSRRRTPEPRRGQRTDAELAALGRTPEQIERFRHEQRMQQDRRQFLLEEYGMERNVPRNVTRERFRPQVASNTVAQPQGGGGAVVRVETSDDMKTFPTQVEASAEIMNEAAATFQASALTMQESIRRLPEQVETAFGGAVTSLEESTQMLSSAIGTLDTASTAFGQTVSQLAEVVTQISTAAESMGGAATQIRDALAQEVSISVTHSHEPITVNIEGGGESSVEGSSMAEFVNSIVGPQIDALRDRIRDVGFGIA